MLKRTLFGVIAMCLCGLRCKKHIIFHILYIIVAPLCPAFLKQANFYKAHHSEKRGVLWLASYPVRCDWPNTSSVRWKCYAPHRIVMQCPGAIDTKTIKHIINEAFVASSGDIITDYNDLYCLFMRCIAPRKHYHVCICDRRNEQTTSTTLHCSKLAFESSVANSLNMKTYLQAVSQKCQTVLAKLELPHFIETAFVQATL